MAGGGGGSGPLRAPPPVVEYDDMATQEEDNAQQYADMATQEEEDAQQEVDMGVSSHSSPAEGSDLGADASGSKFPINSLEDCLELLRHEEDEQRLVGLMLAVKFVAGGDLDCIVKISDAVGFEFIDRLLDTPESGPGFTGPVAGRDADPSVPRGAYAGLALAILSAFCRVPGLASSPEMVEKVPIFLEVIKKRGEAPCLVDAYECLLGVASSSDHGLRAVKEEEPLGVVATDINLSSSDASWLPMAMRFLLFLFSKGVEDTDLYEHKAAIASMIPSLARELAQRADHLKFDALFLLANILSPEEASEPVRNKLQELYPDNAWTADVRTGLCHLLHGRIGDEHRQAALQLTKVVLELEDDGWLTGPVIMSTDGTLLPTDRFFLLLVETLRIEVPILLEQLARLIFDDEEKDKEKGLDQLDGDSVASTEGSKAGENGQGGAGGDSVLGGGLGGGGGLRGGGGLGGGGLGGGLGGGGLGGGGGGLTRGLSMNLAAMDFPAVDTSAEGNTDWGGGGDWDLPQVSPEVQKAQRAVAESFAVLEKVIGAMAKAAAADVEEQTGMKLEETGNGYGKSRERVAELSDETLLKAVSAVDEAMKVVLEFLDQAKVHQKNLDDGVLACVRVVGRFLAEAPEAHRKKVLRLLGFMLSVKASDEEMPVQAVKFLLPALLQITSESQGCKALVKRGGHKQIVKFVQEQARTNVMGSLKSGEEGHGALVEASDVLLNVLGTREDYPGHVLDAQDFAPLFAAAVSWTSAKGVKPRQATTSLAIAACLVASVLEITTEEAVKAKLDLAAYKRLPKAMEVIVKFLELGHKPNGEFAIDSDEKGLWDITVASCIEALPKWPLVKRAIEKSDWWARMTRRTLTRERLEMLVKDRQLRIFLAGVAGFN